MQWEQKQQTFEESQNHIKIHIIVYNKIMMYLKHNRNIIHHIYPIQI